MKGKNKDEFLWTGRGVLKAIGSVSAGGVSQEDPIGGTVAGSPNGPSEDQMIPDR
jgi:hypothetical protein